MGHASGLPADFPKLSQYVLFRQESKAVTQNYIKPTWINLEKLNPNEYDPWQDTKYP